MTKMMIIKDFKDKKIKKGDVTIPSSQKIRNHK